MIRVILADDHAIIRDGIQALLQGEPDMRVVAQASNGRVLLELLATTPADVVLLDLNMPEMDGYEATQQLRADYPEVRVLVLSMLDHEEFVQRIFEAGATGYVLKNAGKSEIIHAIRTVAAGQPFLCTEIGLAMLHKLHALKRDALPMADKQPQLLSRRETEVLKLIAEGLTTSAIAEKLFTSKRTIETHRQNILEKTQEKNTASLIKYAVMHGLLD